MQKVLGTSNTVLLYTGRAIINRGETAICFSSHFMKPYILKSNLHTPLLLTCEHASARIPRGLGKLGLSKAELRGAKDLYDPGSEQLARALAEKLKASILLATTSRLVIDYNRRLDMKGTADNTYHAPALKTELLTELEGEEKIVPILGNQKKPAQLTVQRYRDFVQPYHDAGVSLAQRLVATHGHCLIVSVHSFYPKYSGVERTTDIDVLYDAAVVEGKRFAVAARQHTTLVVEENKPWSLKDADGGVFKNLQTNQGIVLLAIDVNNKLLQSTKGVMKIAQAIIPAIQNELQLFSAHR